MSPPRRRDRPRSSRKSRALIPVALFVVVLVLFGRAARYDFVAFDDPVYVTENPHVRGGLTWENVCWAFGSAGYAGNWHPLTWISHMLDAEMFGLEPGGHHLTSVLLHALCCALLFVAIRRMVVRSRDHREHATWVATVVSGLFAVHPLRIESVVWVSERKDVLGALLWVVCLLAYVAYVNRGTLARYLSVVGVLAVGLMAKPMLVTLPFVLLLLDLWPLDRFGSGGPEGSSKPRPAAILGEKIPLVVLAGASAAVTLYAQQTSGAVSGLAAAPAPSRIANALVAYADYIIDLVWPTRLSVFYPFPIGGIPGWKVAVCASVVLLLSVVALASVSRRPWLTVGWFWYAITLVPVAGLVQVGMQARADRYTYLPHVGLYLILACGLFEIGRRWNVPAKASGAVGLVLMAAYATVTWTQIGNWRDTSTLLTRATEVTQGNFLAHHGLALELEKSGDREGAIEHCRMAVSYYPGYADAHRDLGRLLAEEGRIEEASEQLRVAVRLGPRDARSHLEAGSLQLAAGRADRALREYEEAVRLDPDSSDAHNRMGVALEWLGETGRAVEAYERAVRLRPDLFEPHLNLGGALSRLGRFAEAVPPFLEAVRLKPESGEARLGLGVASFMSGDRETAEEQVRQLQKTDSDRARRLRSLMLAEPGPGGGAAEVSPRGSSR